MDRITTKLTSFAALAFASIFLLSCVSTMGCIGCNSNTGKLEKPWQLKPQESFGLIIVEIEMKPFACEWTHNKAAKKCDIKKLNLPDKVTKSVGSSVVVGKNKTEDKTYVLTAAHVCSEAAQSEFSYQLKDGRTAQVAIKKAVKRIQVTDYTGVTREASVYRIDKPNDLCLITTPGLWGNAFRVSPDDPIPGTKSYNVAAPHKIWAPGMVLMLDGYYSGKTPDGFYHYTIPARPGSSGSPILNEKGLIIGVVQRAFVGFENLAISTSTQAIREILSTIPEEELGFPDPTKIEILKL